MLLLLMKFLARFLHLLLLAGLGLTFAGCASFQQRLNRLDIGMSQAQVERILGRDYVSKAARVDADGSRVRLLEFNDRKANQVFWVFLRNERVVQWGTPESLRHLTNLGPGTTDWSSF